MELVYLWVEDYKNIHEQGFNFSPKFNCHYDGETLTINENIDEDGNKNYIENFFGDNINVTAIVGKNGSGKSNIFKFLNSETYQHVDNYETKMIDAIVTPKAMLLMSDNINKKIIIYSFFLIKENIINNTKNKIYLLEDISKNISLVNQNYSNIYDLETRRKMIDFLTKKIISLPFKAPEYLSINFHDNFSDFNDFINISYDILEIYGNKEEQLIAYEIYLIIASLKKDDIKCDDGNMENLAPSIIREKLQKKINNNDILKIKKIIDTIKNKFVYSEAYRSLTIKIEDLPYDFIDNYNKITDCESKPAITDIILFNFYPEMSDGEYQFLLFFSQLYKKLQNTSNNVLFIDEGEAFLHPNWQKKYISYIVQFIKDNFPNRKIHIILTSHSPFLLSDIPKQNIIFLDKDENRNCKVVDGLKEKKQTFGANIHTLLTDSFFMEGGLMGEFAKQKINEIIENLKDKEYTYTEKEKTNVLLTIESIGEPFLKSKLLDMYNRRFIKDYKMREQKRIDEQIRILKEKREQLDD